MPCQDKLLSSRDVREFFFIITEADDQILDKIRIDRKHRNFYQVVFRVFQKEPFVEPSGAATPEPNQCLMYSS